MSTKLPKYKDNLNVLIDQNTNSTDSTKILYNHLKELDKPVEKVLSDHIIYSLASSISK